jgi:hypothetical protein
MPSGCNVCNSRIQTLYLLCLWFSFQLGLWSVTYILDLTKSSNLCPGDTKRWLTGKGVFLVRSLLCPFILLVNGWTLSSTYLRPVDVTVKEVNHIMRFAIDIVKDTLVRATVSRPSSTVGQCKPCGDKRCKCCLQLQHAQVFHSKTTGKEYNLRDIVHSLDVALGLHQLLK